MCVMRVKPPLKRNSKSQLGAQEVPEARGWPGWVWPQRLQSRAEMAGCQGTEIWSINNMLCFGHKIYLVTRHTEHVCLSSPQRRKRMDPLKNVPFEGWRRICIVQGWLTVRTPLGLDASAEKTLGGRRRGNWVSAGPMTRKCLSVTFPVNPKQTLYRSVSVPNFTHPGVEMKKSDLSCRHSLCLPFMYEFQEF